MPSTGILLAVGAVLAVLATQAVRSWLRLRGPRVITCPENGQRAGVELDAFRAAFGGPFTDAPPRLASCTRWPEKQGCGQECLREIGRTGDGCLVRHILTEWYTGKACACCGKPIGEIDWAARKPALATLTGTTIEWAQVPAEHLDEVMASHRPVCFPCHITSTFLRQHPELVVDRSVRQS